MLELLQKHRVFVDRETQKVIATRTWRGGRRWKMFKKTQAGRLTKKRDERATQKETERESVRAMTE
jgi:hypothetical protein